ncbi:YHS domain-containing (seleno)protein [Luteithermobacter gelatinilyticus]|uniref:YHS domain-containing (seleno)protein n=1 Tax=Luteithermobacter gelatinilyticus TaxID=2582913 RepID=UPI001106FBCE|nr:YHS domain-containing (seleno)protein [Luteithermobacter gelatinilyticus]|tara:strand:+ start:23710 stop:24216 length:507 start_codon:yes stop_codon:yes gene_type:complete
MTNITKYLLIISALVVAIGGGLSFYYASQSYYAESLVYGNDQGIALNGYDPVAYFTEKYPIRGKADYEVQWAGSTWRFYTPSHRDAFAAAPNNYAPQYGGYDPLSVAKGYTTPTDPEVWLVEAGKLYLFYSEERKKYWQENRHNTLLQANANWERLRSQLQYRQSQKD